MQGGGEREDGDAEPDARDQRGGGSCAADVRCPRDELGELGRAGGGIVEDAVVAGADRAVRGACGDGGGPGYAPTAKAGRAAG